MTVCERASLTSVCRTATNQTDSQMATYTSASHCSCRGRAEGSLALNLSAACPFGQKRQYRSGAPSQLNHHPGKL